MGCVTVSAQRPIQVGAFDVHSDVGFLADRDVPILVVFDLTSESVRSTHAWPLLTERRDRSVANEVLYRDGVVFVASPAAGGIVRIDPEIGYLDLIDLDEDVGSLLASSTHSWAIGAPDWLENSRGPQTIGTRPVVWEDVTGRYKEVIEDSRLRLESPLATEEPDTTIEWWKDNEGDIEPLSSPTPLWIVEENKARRVPFEGEAPVLAAFDHLLVGACQLPSDPIIKQVDGSSCAYWYPATPVIIAENGDVEALGNLNSIPVTVSIEDKAAWLVGMGLEFGDVKEVRSLNLDSHELGHPLAIKQEDPIAFLDGYVVAVARWPQPTVQFVSINNPSTVISRPSAPIPHEPPVKIRNSCLWLGGQDSLIRISVVDFTVESMEVQIDLNPYLPVASPPEDVDLSVYESRSLERLRSGLLGGWEGDDGTTRPLINGIDFVSVDLMGTFPETHVVASFRSEDRPGITFARKWHLYDELGNSVDHEYAEIYLMEDVEAMGYGLPPMSVCALGPDGLVWF